MDGGAALEQIHRDHEKPLLGIPADQDAFHVGQRPLSDPHPLPFTQIGIGENRQLGADEPLNGVDLPIRNDLELVPALPEQPHEAARLTDFEVAGLVHGVAEEEIAAEQGRALTAPHAATSRPRLDGGQEQVEALHRELVVYQLLAVAARPQDTPGWGHRLSTGL